MKLMLPKVFYISYLNFSLFNPLDLEIQIGSCS